MAASARREDILIYIINELGILCVLTEKKHTSTKTTLDVVFKTYKS